MENGQIGVSLAVNIHRGRFIARELSHFEKNLTMNDGTLDGRGGVSIHVVCGRAILRPHRARISAPGFRGFTSESSPRGWLKSRQGAKRKQVEGRNTSEGRE